MTEPQDVGDEIDLKVLTDRLTVVGMPTQAVIARESGVSQSTVSRASQGLIKTPSDGARRLWTYTSSRLEVIASTPAGRAEQALDRIPKSRRKRQRRRQPDQKHGSDMTTLSAPELRELAVAGLQDYLADAFDPLLIIEQLSVLRRAQDRGAR
jgi:transcriptional regulator with XRE-family HTH domain